MISGAIESVSFEALRGLQVLAQVSAIGSVYKYVHV